MAKAACAGILLLAAWLMLHDLGVAPLVQHDEGTYAQVVGESLARGDFLTFTWRGEIFFDKPPLYFWLAGLATAFTGDPVLGIRLPAALGGVALVSVAMLLAYALAREWWVAALVGAVLVATPPLVQAAREARLDILVSLFIMFAVLCFIERRYVWFGAMVGLAVLSKSVIAVFALVFVLAWWFMQGRPALNPRLWWGALAALAVALPWHIYEWLLYGSAFWQSYIGMHIFGRYQTNLFGDPLLKTDYTAHLFAFAPLVTGLTILSSILIPLYIGHLKDGLRAGLLAAFAALGVMLVIFYSAQTHAFSYLVPAYPLAALAIGLATLGLKRFITRSSPA